VRRVPTCQSQDADGKASTALCNGAKGGLPTVASSQELSARRGIACRGFHLPQESRRRALHRGNLVGQEESLTQQLVKLISYAEECDLSK